MATTITTPGGGGTPAAGPQAALDLVRPVQPLLAGFAHRNKNQHRGARWFASFAMLRRHVDKLADETAARAAAARPPKKKKKKPPQGDQDGGDDDDDGPAPRRARWLRDVLVPKCYLCVKWKIPPPRALGLVNKLWKRGREREFQNHS